MRCKYIRKIFQNEENGYTVALFSTLDHEVPLSARDKFWADKKIIAFTAKGYDLPLTDEIEIEMEGEWETNSHGTQYKVETFLEVVPRTREGILGYLSCGSLKGIGPKTAERIVNRFGLDTLEVMEKYPQELLKIQGISQKKLDRIVDSFGKNKVFRELMTFLSPFHVTPKKANMILQKFRDQSVEIIRKQPYILCSVKGFGFLTVDAIARQCCAATNDPMRISGCVSYVLREAMKQNGHLYLEQEILVKDALKVLNKELNLQPVTETEILKVLYRLVMQDSIVVEENRVYITQQHQEEEDTASMIARKLHERIPVLTIEKELEEAQEDLNITLSEQQKEAVRMVFANPISIITGGPGTGKTTVLKIILYIYQKKCGNEVKLMAPTGRAARRMAESTGSGDATTMHMALGLFGDGDYEALIDELSADFINVDEVSMVDMHLAYEFFYKRFCENQKIKLESIFTDKITGKNFDRPRYTVLVEDVLRVGDTLIITELDRLGRNKQEILKQLRFLEEKGVRVMVLELPTTLFDLSQMENNLAKMMIETINNMMIELYASMAQAEMEKKEKRQKEGMEAKRLRGEWDEVGRPRAIEQEKFNQEFMRVVQKKVTPTQLQRELGLTSSTYYRYRKNFYENFPEFLQSV